MSDDLDELLRLHGKATGGEWHVNEFDDAADEVERYQVQTSRRQGGDIGGTVLAVFDAEWILPRQAKANAELAVSAHNALPGLIERVRKAEAERDALREVAEAAQAVCDDSQGVDAICEGVLRKRMTALRAALAKVAR